MDQASSLESWKILLDKIDSYDRNEADQVFHDLAKLFQHVSPQIAIRLQKDHDLCARRSEQLLGELFDKIDLSDKPLLCAFLCVLRSFGYFRIAQIAHHIESHRDELQPNQTYTPTIVKASWYDLTPLLPPAGTLGWKGLINHCLVEEEKELMNVCLQLLTQKLHFLAIISNLDRFQTSEPIITRNGEKVAKKLFELIRDASFDDRTTVGIDTTLFKLLLPFANDDQQAALVEAVVQDLFKPYLLQKPILAVDFDQLLEVVTSCIMDRNPFQDRFISCLIENLKCNIIRRKRRHSVEVSQEEGKISFESLLNETCKEGSLAPLEEKLDTLELSAKSIQTGYICYWLQSIDQIIPFRALSANSSIKIIYTCVTVLVTTYEVLGDDLVRKLAILLSKAFENTGQPTKLFKRCDIQFLVRLTELLSRKTTLLSTFETPLADFYQSYFSRFLAKAASTRSQEEVESLSLFIDLICDKNLSKGPSRLLQYTYVHEMSKLLETHSTKANKMLDVMLSYASKCSNRLHKPIKRSALLRDNLVESKQDMFSIDENDSASLDDNTDNMKETLMVDSLVSILRIGLGLVKKDQKELLDSYSDLLLKLFKALIARVERLLEVVQTGRAEVAHPLDFHLMKLVVLYTQHKDTIESYLMYDLVQVISSLLPEARLANKINGETGTMKEKKKLVYNEIKTKLDDLGERVIDHKKVYSTIINKQNTIASNSIVDSNDNIKKEKSCMHSYRHQIKTLNQILTTLLDDCDLKVYEKHLRNTTDWLENCNPLDHAKVLFHILMLEILISSVNKRKSERHSIFRELLPRISCSLIRISKTVELGPSIHVFFNSGSHKSNKSIQCCTYSNCIKINTLIFLNFPQRISNEFITDAMQMCVNANLNQYSKYSDRLHRFFIQLASAILGLLQSICIGTKEDGMLRTSMPVYLSVFSNLIGCLICASDRQKLESQNKSQQNGFGDDKNAYGETNQFAYSIYESQLELLAMEVGKVMNNLSLLRVKMIDFAPHLISNYVQDIQKASCAEPVRLHLNEGIFRIFNLIDAHQREREDEVVEAGVQRKTRAGRARGSLFELIHARLDQASREVFHDMHDNYNRFFRYLGKC